MARLSSTREGQTTMIPTPRFGSSSQGVANNCTNYSNQQGDEFSVPKIVPAPTSSSTLVGILNEGQIEDSLARAKLLSYQLEHALMNETGNNNDHGDNDRNHGAYRNLIAKAIGCKTSEYRGVTKCNDDRFEAYVWDNTIPGESGRTVYIGGYSTEIEAAKAHDLVSIKTWGLSTVTNFPVKNYWREIYEMQQMSKKDYILAIRRKGKGYTENDSPYRGVYKIRDRRRWEARLGNEGMPTIYLGTYYTAEDAARAYDIASIELKGWDAITNFDLNSYDVKNIMESAKHNSWGISFPQMTQTNNEIQTHPQSKSNTHIPSSNSYTLGGSNGNHGAQLQQPLKSNVNFNNGFNQNLLNNNQFLHHSSSIRQNRELQKCLENFPSSFGKKLLGVNMKFEAFRYNMLTGSQGATASGVSSFGSNSTEIHQVEPSNEEFDAAQPLQSPQLDQSYESYNFDANILNQNPHQNINSCFSDSFQNLFSEPNNNTGSLNQMAEIQNDFDISDYLDSSFLQEQDNDLERYLASINGA